MRIEELIPNKAASRVLCAALDCASDSLRLQVMVTHWVAVPWWDEWLTPGETLASYSRGTLRFADLWSQHNESRKLFPRLLYLALYVPWLGCALWHELDLCLGLCRRGWTVLGAVPICFSLGRLLRIHLDESLALLAAPVAEDLTWRQPCGSLRWYPLALVESFRSLIFRTVA